MNYRAITTLALRLTGIAVLVKILPYASTTFVALARNGAESPRQALLLTTLAVTIPLIAGLALIYFPARLSSLVVGSGAAPEADDQSDRLGDVAMIAVGVYFCAAGIFDLIYYFSRYWLFDALVRKGETSLEVSILPHDFAGLITAVFQIAVGAILALKANSIYRWILRVRETRPKA